MTERLIKERNLPKVLGKSERLSDFLLRREEFKRILSSRVYGEFPERPEHLRVSVLESDESFSAGRAVIRRLEFTVTLQGEEYSFYASSVIPKDKPRCPAIIHISYSNEIPNRFEPTEELLDEGFAVFSIDYKSVTEDGGNFRRGIAGKLVNGRRNSKATGKIAIWAWSAMRVMDYLLSLPEIDKENVAVAGHSILGKSALLAGAFDERFKFVIANCSGVALMRGSQSSEREKLKIEKPYLFCPKYSKSCTEPSGKSSFDMHFLLSLIAPRYLLVGSALGDYGTDYEGELLSCAAASEAYKIFGLKGLMFEGEIPHCPIKLQDGEISFHLRTGDSYFAREDWRNYIEFMKKRL